MHGSETAVLIAGIPAGDMTLFHRIRFAVGDPAAWIAWATEEGDRSHLIVRDIEMDRARKSARADEISCPADWTPSGGLSGDRAIATAQATAEFLRRGGCSRVVCHRDLPLLFADCLRERGLEVECDRDLGVSDRRAKDEEEIEALRNAQEMTESAIRLACETIASAEAAADGVLHRDGDVLTSERIRSIVDRHLIDRGMQPRPTIVAGGTDGGDCHELGSGQLRTGEPVIIDCFPRDPRTLYNGDCTRTVVHGDVPDAVRDMHAAVVAAKTAAEAAVAPGRTGEEVHKAAIDVIAARGYAAGPADPSRPSDPTMPHGTGHGLGLDVHELPLLDRGGPPLVRGDALTIEPGLYAPGIGGIRVEDLVIVESDGVRRLNHLPMGLDWR